ncbi:MAG: hypothetical protein JW888_13875 [Pirellulales bacterium]|nr:hypothetical protein [Pirellulales bacterium]
MRTKKTVWILAIAFCLGVLAASVVQSAQSVLDVIPDDALGFAVVNRIGTTDAKIKKLASQIEAPVPGSPLQKLKQAAQVETGLDEKGAAAAVAMPAAGSNERPRPLIAIPVTDYKEFIGQFDPEEVTDTISRVRVIHGRSLVAQKGDYALFVEVGNQDLLESMLKSKKSVAEQVKPWQEWIEQSDAVVIVTGPAIKMFTTKASGELDKVKPMFEAMGEQGKQAAAAFEMYQKMLDLAGKEVATAGMGVLIEEDGVRISGLGQFAPGGQMAGWFKNMKAPPSNRWVGVPNEPFVLAGAGALPEGLMESLMEFSVNMMQNMPNIYGLDEKQMREFGKISAGAMKNVRGMAMAMGVTKPGQPLYQAASGTMWVDDSQVFLERYAELIQSMTKLAAGAEKSPLANMDVNVMEIAGHNGLKLTMDLSTMYDQPGMEQFAPLFKAMYGPDSKMDVYMAAADKTTVVFSYIDKDRAVEAVKAVTESKANMADNAAVAAMTKQLPADAQWVGFWSPRGTVALAQQMMKDFAPEGSAMTLPEFPETPPVGFAMTVSATGVHKELLIPVEVLKNMPVYMMKLRMMQMDMETD